MFVAQVMRLAKAHRQLLVVVSQLDEHVIRGDEIGVVVEDTLQATYVAHRAHRRAADLANTLGDIVRCREDLVGLLVRKKMIVAET